MDNYNKFIERYNEYKKIKISDIFYNSKTNFIKIHDIPQLMKPINYYTCVNKFFEFGKIKYIYDCNNITKTNSCKKEINKVELNSLILFSNNNWVEIFGKLFKYKKKVIISNKTFENKDDTTFYMKIENIINNNIIWDIMIFDTDNLDNLEIKKNIENLIKKSKYKIFIINKNNKNNNLDILCDNIDLLFNDFINVPIYNEERKIVTEFNNIIKLDELCNDTSKTPNKMGVLSEKVNIIRNKYKLNEIEKKIIEITKDLNILDKIELKNIENKSKSNVILNNNNNKELCIICDENKKLSCLENCGHKFCLECILKVNFSDINNSCPLCRTNISLDNLIYFDKKLNSRIILIKNVLEQFKNEKGIIYSNSEKLRDFIYNFGKNSNYNIDILDNRKKIDDINLLIVNPNNYKKVSKIKNINNVIIIDNKYNYILHKEALGYDFNNNFNNINIYIYEYE
jgi:hypothetical protein